MSRRVRFVLLIAALVACLVPACASTALAQQAGTATLPALERGPGGYLSIAKIGLIAIVFLIWVRLADWVNRDSIKWVRRLDMAPETWNPILVGSFFVGFLCAISVPMFLVGYSIFVLAAFVPPMAYFLTRRSKIAETPSVARAMSSRGGDADAEILPQDDGVQVDFSPAGANESQQQANLIEARQSSGFVDAKQFLFDNAFKRAEQVMLDFGRERVAGKMLVDGVWHPLPPREREPADAMLVSLKSVAGLNATDRRSRQQGTFGIKTELGKSSLELVSQGTKTGERVMLKFVAKAPKPLDLVEAGMFPEMSQKVRATLNGVGLGIVSAPPGAGLTTSWKAVVAASDRLSRDCVAIVTSDNTDCRIENIANHESDDATTESQQAALKKVLLTQPDMLIMPEIADSAVMDVLTHQATVEERSVLTQTKAKSAAEALLRVYAKAGDRNQFIQATKFATNQRLLRKLCNDCKQKTKAPPKTIQQLGGDPAKQKTLYSHWRLPPPEQRVDEKGREIEFPPCKTCGGLGYQGQIAVYEMLEMNEQVVSALKSNPKVDAVEQAARKSGKTSLSQQTYKLVLLGVTSLAEAQRMLKSK